jgi:outer membrane protein assembly complex protein YaeT
LALASAADAQATNTYLGKTISAVAIQAADLEIPTNRQAQLLERLPKPGQTLTRSVLRNAVQSLYSTMEFSDVRVDAEPDGGQVKLTFITRTNLFIGALKVEDAPRPPTDSQLINSTKLEMGHLFSQDELDAAVANMKGVMADNGYYRAEIHTEVQQKLVDKLVNVTFHVIAGAQARVGMVAFSGESGFSDLELHQIAKMHRGDKVSPAMLNRALNRLRKRFQKQDRLEAQVAIADRRYRPETNTVDFDFRIDRGSKVEIRLEGASIRRGLMKRYVPVFEEHAVDDDLLNEGMRNLRDYLQSEGYFDAQVAYSRGSENGTNVVTYRVEKGERHTLKELAITGNKYFRDDEVRELMAIAPASLWLYYGRFSQSRLARDAEAIENRYRANGFRRIKVTPKIEDDINGNHGDMRLTMNIEEGPQTLVSNFSIEGNQKIASHELQAIINTAEGQPYSEVTLATDRDSIVNYYFNRGFPDVQLEAFAEPAQQPERMNVRYRITEGAQEFVSRVIVSGLDTTKPFVVRRELEVQSGSALSQADMLNTQQRLYDVGIFSQVNVAIQNPEGTERNKNVLIQVDEAKRYTFTYGFGLEVQTGDVGSACKNLPNPAACQPEGRMGVSPRVSFDVTRLNFLGRDYTLLLKSRVGRLQQRALVSLEAPRVFNSTNKTLTFTSFFDKTQDVRTFTAERLEGSAQVQHTVDKATQMLYRIVYRRVQVDPTTLQVDPNLIPLLSRPVRVGFPSATYIRDTRDNPIESTRGVYSTADVDVASKIFASESNFTRVVLQNSSYHVVKKSKNNQRLWVVARSTRLGIAEPYGSLDRAFVPLPERFFAGGSNSHRGFAINQAGPRDLQTGFPIGGNALFVNSIELRTPSIALPFVEDKLSAVFFHDAGNVFSSPSSMTHNIFKMQQPHQSACKLQFVCDYDYMSHAVGGGLRYRTPIGPVRVDVGYNLNPPFYAQGNQGTVNRLSRINFYFSIGQTF